MTKKEIIYNALGMIEGAVCVSQKNTRDVLMKAIEMIKNAVEEEKVDEIIIDWDDAPITYDDVPYDVKELVECGVYTEEEALEVCNRSRKRHKKYINISEDNT